MTTEFDIDAFEWESQDQKKGFMALFQYLRRHGVDPRLQDVPGRLLATYFIQRELEANDWWLQLLNTQADRMLDRVAHTMRHLDDGRNAELASLRARVEALEGRRVGVDQSLVLGDNGGNTGCEGV